MRGHRASAAAVLGVVVSILSTSDAADPADPPSNPRAALTQCRAVGLATCPTPFDEVLPRPVDMLSWDQRSRVVGFRNTYRLYHGDVFRTLGAVPLALAEAPSPLPPLRYEMGGRSLALADYLHRQSVAGLLIIKSGQVAFEYYGGGNTDRTLWTSRSVAKSVVSILVGMAIKEGQIGSVDDPVARYLPELKGTAWDGVSLRNLLQHTSGVEWNEDYADPTSDFAKLMRCESLPVPYPCVFERLRQVHRKAGVKPGERWTYNTGGAWLVGRVLEQATGMTIAHYLETRLWSRYAMERDGVWESLVPGHVDMGGHGFNATLRDWGRFALFVAGGGKLANGEPLLPADWLAQSVAWTRARGSVTPATPDGQYGFQWWLNGLDPNRGNGAEGVQMAQQTFWAFGIYGQAIAINPHEHLVMVQWSTWKEAETPASLYVEQALFFNAVALALRVAN